MSAEQEAGIAVGVAGGGILLIVALVIVFALVW